MPKGNPKLKPKTKSNLKPITQTQPNLNTNQSITKTQTFIKPRSTIPANPQICLTQKSTNRVSTQPHPKSKVKPTQNQSHSDNPQVTKNQQTQTTNQLKPIHKAIKAKPTHAEMHNPQQTTQSNSKVQNSNLTTQPQPKTNQFHKNTTHNTT